jgi:1,4-alpha-glucan branching enzyme
MTTTADMHELMDIFNGNHADPHHLLGMHEVKTGRKVCKVIRVFNPEADSAEALDTRSPDETIRYPMERIHKAGFFEAELPAGTDWFHYQVAYTGYDGSCWQVYDPYSFMPVLSELDLYLFGQGTHYGIYNKLGAHPMTVDGVDGVLFAVWAPNARRVSVVGDFNDWHGLRHMMRTLQNSGIWELFVPGLQKYDKYKFEIKSLTGALFHKTDPYANFCELRPGTAALVYDINRHTWGDAGWMDSRGKNNPLDGPINIYELHAGSWRRLMHDPERFMSWPELSAELIPYIKDLGYTHIELMPIMEYPFDGSWGYQVTGYFAPTSRYGNPDEFMAFIDVCHQNGIGVIVDWVPAHFPKDAFALARFDGTALYEHDDPQRGEHPDWGTLIFNYGRAEVKNFLIANALFWIDKYHIDGLRVDAVASMLYLDYGRRYGDWKPNKYGGRENLEAVEFMKHMNSVIRGKHPNVMMIAEESTAWAGVSHPVEENGLGFSLKWNMGWMNDFLSYLIKDAVYRKYHHNYLTFGMMYAYTENFILVLSHDEVVHGKGSMVNKMPGDTWQKMANLRAAYGFMIGHPGKKLLFMGGEFAQFEEWSETKPLNWFLMDNFEHHRQMWQYVKDLNHIYLKETACWHDDFKGGGFEWINCGDAQRSLVSFFRRYEKRDEQNDISVREYVLFVINFTPVPLLEHRIGVPEPGLYAEILNSDDHKYGGSGIINPHTLTAEEYFCDNRGYSIPVRMPPLGCVILKGTIH